MQLLSEGLCKELEALDFQRQQPFLVQEVQHICKQAVDGELTAVELNAFAVSSFGAFVSSA